MRFAFATATVLAFAGGPAFADGHDAMKANATLMGAEDAEHGTVTLQQTAAGVLLTAELKDVPAGVHAFHIHAVGTCEAGEGFKTAGGHFNPAGAKHGLLAEGGPHAGDMPNIHVPENGMLTIEVLNTMVSLEDDAEATLFDDDGSAIMIHAGADDYETDPAGDAGPRIACGVIEKN